MGLLALSQFKNVKRRMEVKGVVNDITVYDDFAHHPTAIRTTLEGLRNKVGHARIIAVLEPRSNTMKMGVWKENLAESLNIANQIFCYTDQVDWDVVSALASIKHKSAAYGQLQELISAVALMAHAGDHILIMSNGGFGGIHEKLLLMLQK